MPLARANGIFLFYQSLIFCLMENAIKHGLKSLCNLANCYEPKKRKYLRRQSVCLTHDKNGVLMQFCGKAHNYSIYVKL